MYNLPLEIQRIIYSYDGTFKEKYDDIIKILKRIPNFESYKIIDNNYLCEFYDVYLSKIIPNYDNNKIIIRAKNFKQVFKILIRITFKPHIFK